MVIETQRLILREMIEDDFDAIYKVLADSDIMQHCDAAPANHLDIGNRYCLKRHPLGGGRASRIRRIRRVCQAGT